MTREYINKRHNMTNKIINRNRSIFMCVSKSKRCQPIAKKVAVKARSAWRIEKGAVNRVHGN